MNNELTLEQLRFARAIGATHATKEIIPVFLRNITKSDYEFYSTKDSKWSKLYGVPLCLNYTSHSGLLEINFAPLDEAEQEKSHPKNERGTGMKYDSGKPRMGLLPPLAITEMAKVMTFGANKYQAHSWKQVENAQERYLDALLRHAIAYVAGERIDPESGLPTMAHIMCDAAFLIELDMDITHWMPLPTPPEPEK